MSYQAIICRACNIREHPNASRLNLATVSGYQVILDKSTQEGEMGIFFPCDGQLSHEHLMANKLYRKDPATGEPMGGYFEPNGRVRAIKLRGSMSDGFWQPLSALEWAGDISQLKEGDEICELNGHKLCQKYYTPRTRRAMAKNKQGKQKKKRDPISYRMLKEHYDTKQLRNNIKRIPKGALLYFHEKKHGTSGRTGHILVGRKNRWYHKLFAKLFKCEVSRSTWEYVSGSRRVVLTPKKSNDGYYKDANFRQVIHDKIKSLGLHKGETLYYEIVGYMKRGGGPLMGHYSIEDKETKKQYGKSVVFSYGCDPEEKPYDFYVYRITMTNPDGDVTEYSQAQLEARCKELGLKHGPNLAEPIIYDGDYEKLYEKCYALSDGPSLLDDKHFREGIVLRIESPLMDTCLKLKGDTYCIAEGIRKNDPEFLDLEEVS